MSSKKGGGGKGEGSKSAGKKHEVLQVKSPAEFFAENQNIAGFDNAGKALYTTIREFAENSLDAAESAARLPDVHLQIEEMDTPTFNKMRGVDMRKRKDKGLYAQQLEGSTSKTKKGRGGGGGGGSDDSDDDENANESDGDDDEEDDDDDDAGDGDNGDGKKPTKPIKKGGDKKKGGAGGGGSAAVKGDEQMYYRITCKDNGCGMPHERIPDFLGRVLAGSKYGVRQTRGKFGLGAKMALIWSKKSTGLPIEVRTAHATNTKSGSSSSSATTTSSSSTAATSATTEDTTTSSSSQTPSSSNILSLLPSTQAISTAMIRAPPKLSYCKLDIDIYKNCPHVLEHTLSDNTGGWIGTEISVTISGAWGAYRPRVLRYFQQLAVITPYAQFSLDFQNISIGANNGKGDFSYMWRRRSTQIPRPPIEVKHHPSSVNDLLARQLIDLAKVKASTSTLVPFLVSQFQCIDRPLALRLVSELGCGFAPDTAISELGPPQIHKLTRLLAVAKFDKPSGDCLSPAGEYNLRLGIMKELRPDLVATHSAPVDVFEGHPFIVETGVALGGTGPQGLTVHRFANRIPLLFEGGADVATRTAQRIPWNTYKIDVDRDKVAVFVSLVSTKIPFKGTGKEYIGDDIDVLRECVRRALMECCSQLRVKLLRAQAARARANRRKNLTKYVPDVVRAVQGALKAISNRRVEMAALVGAGGGGDGEEEEEEEGGAGGNNKNSRKRASSGMLDRLSPKLQKVMEEYNNHRITDSLLSGRLLAAVEKADMEAALEAATAATSGLGLGAEGAGGGGSGDLTSAGSGSGLNVFLGPTGIMSYKDSREMNQGAAVIKFLPNVVVSPQG